MIEVERVSADRLSRDLWEFRATTRNFSGDTVMLSLREFRKESRSTTRHGWKTSARWDSMDERSYHSSLTRDAVPMPDDVLKEAIQSIKIEVERLT